MGLIDSALGLARAAAGSVRLSFGAGLPLGELTRVLGDRFGDRPAIAMPGRRMWTYAMLEREVARMAAALEAGGVRAGETVAVVCGNRPDILVALFGLARIGAVPAPLNHRLRPEEQAAALESAGATAAVVDPELEPALLALRLRLLRFEALTGWMQRHPREQRTQATRGADPALLLATSGTTGQPKLARIPSRALLGAIGRFHALPVGHQRGLRAGRDVVLAALPLTHVMGVTTMLGALCAGVKVLHLERFDARRVLARIEADEPNVFVGVPTMYADLESAGAAQRDLSSVELWVSAADAMPPDRARRFQLYGALERVAGRRLGTAAFADVYGMVELAGPAALRLYPPAPRGRELPAIGFVLPGFSARVVGADGKARRLFGEGELQLRGPGIFSGYVGAEPPAGAWFATGDVARLGPGGTFAFVGRSGDRLKVGGFSVFPAEVEAELRAFPGLAELAIVGVPDPRLGQVPAALVVASGGFDEQKFLAWAADRVAGYRRPRSVVRVPSLPRGPNGKLDRRAAAALAQRS
ncbi:MAG TPA: class I adenylate-forming enzyme family protein [Myxococcales bacterium]|nr:class I adenylate-forming enzyme family protein [Myxococcales bacterium]